MSNQRKIKPASPRSTPGAGKPDGWDDYTPPRIDTSGPEVEAERMPLFYVDDVEHSAPRRVSAPTAVGALRVAATQGPEAAAWHMLETSLDPDTLDVLQTCKHMTYEQAQDICTRLGNLYYGQAQQLSGK